MMLRQISINQLSNPCITRDRGREAFNKLQKYLEDERVEINFDNCEVVSLSFLDELITHIMRSSSLEKVIFRVSDQIIEDKLARVSGIRNVTLYHRSDDDNIRRIVPKSPWSEKATFVATKASL